MAKERVLKPSEITIMTFYKAQVHLYKQALRDLPEEYSAFMNIKVKTVDSMQGFEEPFIIIDVAISKTMGFYLDDQSSGWQAQVETATSLYTTGKI